jgi:lipopolysaccharide biosynthesis protein
VTSTAAAAADRRLIAFYLPQFHPILENDEWWGKGFTEWRNVVQAVPRFRGHHQPHLPSDLGFYDLRVSETRERQAELARAHGIFGFCYYHYWFNARRLLERPFNDVLRSGQPKFPFCLCWANENWTRAWDGQDREILIGQEYGPDDDRRHLRSLASAFADDRYIRIDDKPVFLVYRSGRMPNPKETTAIWREEAHRLGLGELVLLRVESFPGEVSDPTESGFDAAVEFQPAWARLGPPERRSFFWRLASLVGLSPWAYQSNHVFNYDEVVKRMIDEPLPTYLRYPCVTPMWDNSARRREGAVIFEGSTPERYGSWLETTLRRFIPPSADENLVFINGWNEWAEGNHLEPDQRWGRAYLEATRDALARFRTSRSARELDSAQ